MLFEQAIAHQVPGYTREADSAHGESLAMLDYKDELRIKHPASTQRIIGKGIDVSAGINLKHE